jgi:hypothetical protein
VRQMRNSRGHDVPAPRVLDVHGDPKGHTQVPDLLGFCEPSNLRTYTHSKHASE